MARYIDADALIKYIKCIYCTDCNNYNEVRCRACKTDDALRMIDDAPTADVAPRADVAREIFEEIENIAYTHFDVRGDEQSLEILIDEFAELKKKYTGEKT